MLWTLSEEMRETGQILTSLIAITGLVTTVFGANSLEEKQARSFEAFKEHLKAGRLLSEGKGRRELALHFSKLANDYPDTERGALAKELALFLTSMADEDETFQPPEDVAKLSEEQRIHYHVYKLRDLADREMSEVRTTSDLYDLVQRLRGNP